VLYTVRKRRWSWGDEEIVAHTLATGARKVLLTDAADARYLPTGHLVFLRRGTLFAVPFDAERLEVRGPAVAVLDTVAQALTSGHSDNVTGAGQFAISSAGTLAWVPSPIVPYPDRTLVSVDRHGQFVPLSAPARSYGQQVRLSPDRRRLAVTIQTLTEVGLWLYDLDRGVLTPLAAGGEVTSPRWVPDGRRLVFNWLSGGRQSLAAQPADGTAPPGQLVAGDLSPSSWTPDGRRLAAVPFGGGDIRVVDVEGEHGSVQPLFETPYSELWPEFSPDGRWLAYGSNVSGRYEVYVRPYPGPGPAEQASIDGGSSPAWHPDGKELFFLSDPDPAGQRSMLAVEFRAGPSVAIGRPRLLFAYNVRMLSFYCMPLRCYDVAPAGERFYAQQWMPVEARPPVTHVNLILNWFEELKAKVPATR
jgi:serine/threonine-protein kinase